MKKIDKLIFGAFVGPFSLTFIVVVFIFLTQYLLKYLDEFVGKGVGAEVFAELIFYFSINMVPVSLPLAVLLSSLMTFGNLGEHFELTAIKGSGISLTRVLIPVGVAVIILSAGSFIFSNTIVPRTNLRAYSLLYDIRQKKPALDIKEGAFYNGLPGYSVKISKKHEDNKTLEGLMIYNHTGNKGNTELILADSGMMYTIHNEEYLVLEMFNGKSYTEYIEDGASMMHSKEFVRNSFDQSKIIFSLASFKLNHTPVELFSTNRVMKTIETLDKDIDSMRTDASSTAKSLYTNIQTFYPYKISVPDSVGKELQAKINTGGFQKLSEKMANDTLSNSIIYNRAVNNARGIKAYLSGSKDRIAFTKREIRMFQAEKYKKFTQACACFIMFLIGAPLGAIIKKGGFGVPVIISIVFFIIYYIVTMFGEKWAKEEVTSVEFGMWMGNMILLPIGLFFLRQARKDSRLLETDFYSILFSKWRNLFGKKKI